MNQLDLSQLEATENVQYCLGLDMHILLMFNICISPQCPNLVKNVKCDWFRERSSQRAGSCCWICGSVTERKWKSPAVVRVNNHKLVHLLLLFSFYLCYSVHRASPETIEWVNVCERVRKCVCVLLLKGQFICQAARRQVASQTQKAVLSDWLSVT